MPDPTDPRPFGRSADAPGFGVPAREVPSADAVHSDNAAHQAERAGDRLRALHRWPTGDPADRTRRRWGFPLRAAVLAVLLVAGFVLAGTLTSEPGVHEVAELALSNGSEQSEHAQAAGETGVAVDSPGSAPAGSSGAPGGGEGQQEPGGAGQADGFGELPANGNAAAPSSSELVVHVAGAVVNPGVVRVPAGARAADAVAAAGGLAEDAHPAGVNLAAPLSDGAMLVVPRRDEAVAMPPPGAPGSGPAGAAGPGGTAGPGLNPGGTLVNLNTADAAQLQELPRVGPVLAERILQWRAEHGGFGSVDELDAVPGIGEAMMASLRPLVTV